MKKTVSKPNEIIEGLMDYLEETGEEYLIKDVSEELDSVVSKSRKAEEIEVVTFQELDEKQKNEIKSIVKRILNLDLPLRNVTDKKIIGGLKITVGDWMLDATVKRQLENIKNLLIQ